MSRLLNRRAVAMGLLLVSAVALAQQQGGQRNRPAGGPAAPEGQPARSRQPSADASPADAKQGLDTFEEKLSYALGVNTARRMRNDGVDPEPKSFSRGVIDGFADKSLMSDEEMTAILQQWDKQLKEKAAAAQKEYADSFEASFSDEKKPKGETKTTPSGLEYEVFEEGEGPKPKPTDVAVFHYIGRLAKDGKVFDSSVARGEPLAYPVNKLIPGWVEGLPLMSVGSKYRFHIPAKLGYGEEGFPPRIGPNEDLVFDVHLLQIAPQEQAPPGDAPSAPEGDAPEAGAPPRE